MTKELQVIQRRVIEEGVNLGGTTAFKDLQSSFTQLSGFGTGLATQLAVERSTAAGKQFAIDAQGEPQKLAPGLTAATRAYNNAYNDVTISLLGTQGDSLISDNLRSESLPGNLGPNSLARFGAINKSTIEGILSQTPVHLQADVALQLMKSTENAAEVLAGRVSALNSEMIAKEVNDNVKRYSKDLKTAILTDKKEDIEFNRAGLKNTYQSAKDLGVIDKFQFNAALEALDDKESVFELIREARVAEATGTFESWSAVFVNRDIPDDIKFEAWDTIAKEHAVRNSQVAGMVELTNQVSDLAMRRGEFTEENMEVIQDTLPVIPALKIANKWQAQKDKELGGIRAVTSINEALQNNDKGTISRAAPKDINDTYLHNLSVWTEHQRQETGDPNYQATPTDKTFVAKQFPAEVKAYTKEAGTVMRAGSPQEAIEWARAMSALEENRDTRIVLNGLDQDEKSIYLMLSERLRGTDVDPTLITEQVRDEVLRKKDSDIVEASTRTNKWMTKNVNTVNKAYKSFVGGDPDNFHNTVSLALYRESFGDALRRTNDPDAAERGANNAMRSWSKSKYSPNDISTRAAMENELPFSDFGNQLDNQVYFFEQAMIEETNKSNEELGITFPEQIIRFPENRAVIKGGITENEMLYKQFNIPTDFQPDLEGIAPIARAQALESVLPFGARSKVEFQGEVLPIWYDFSHVNDKTGMPVYKPYVIDDNNLVQYFRNPKTENGVWMFEPKLLQDVAPGMFEDITSDRAKRLKDRISSKAFDQIAEPLDLTTLSQVGAIEQVKAARARGKERKAFISAADEATIEEIGKLIGVTRLNATDRQKMAEFMVEMRKRKEAKDAG